MAMPALAPEHATPRNNRHPRSAVASLLVLAVIAVRALGASTSGLAVASGPVLVDLGAVSWAPGAAILAAATPPSGVTHIYRIDTAGNVRSLSYGVATSATWSPDGARA